MKTLVIGSGAREHAIVHALRRSPSVREIYAAPGNPGIAEAADVLPIAVDDLPSLAEAAADLKIDLTVVGPELPLALGIGDTFAGKNLRLFGPTSHAAQLEASKVFAKEFCFRNDIPTARARVARSRDETVAAVREIGLPVVLKADGLAAGKGVLIVKDDEDLERALAVFFEERRFGEAGEQVLVEEFLEGEELSFMVISDGKRFVPLATSHDYKRALDGDQGPNTGGMGSHSPAVLAPGVGREVIDKVVRPVIAGMEAEGRTYRGILYVGLMLTDEGPMVLEFNCRLGDPEAQSILLRLDDDFGEALKNAADGALSRATFSWRREAVACVVLAAQGYPGNVRRGDVITGIDEALALPRVTVYQAGTARDERGRLITAGGRVLSVCGRGTNLAEALSTAYSGVDMIHFEGKRYRTDIGADSLSRLGGS
ncbi:MAG TPA: phosphoribosylamine--glycine ligase [Acidobacteria bacterium]|nr:phosphoribosylamine--glycine ligase [Acidobacteriota bacterium]